MWGITHKIHPVTENQCWFVIAFSAINYILRNSDSPTYLNHYYLDHQYQYYLPIRCHCMMKYIPFDVMVKILGIILCYQDEMMILL